MGGADHVEKPFRVSQRLRNQILCTLCCCCVGFSVTGSGSARLPKSSRLRGNLDSSEHMLPPLLLYGTAWKKEMTKELVLLALRQGFRGVDTACQPKHYREDLVGEALASSGLAREEYWIQTKFTPLPGQDARVPYDPMASLETQVDQSIAKSLENLKTSRIDSLVLHSPLGSFEDTMLAWRRFEAALEKGVVSQLGVSNCYDADYFKRIYESAKHKPKVLQNRFYSESGYDQKLRKFCKEHDVVYQTFWTLTANPQVLKSHPVKTAAKRLDKTPQQILFAWLVAQGHQPLTGTKDPIHMEQDLEATQLQLSEDELRAIGRLF